MANVTTSENMKMIILQAEIAGVLNDLLVRSHVDNVLVTKEDGSQILLSEKLAEMIAAINLKANSTDVTAEITAANDALYNRIMGITAEDGATVEEAYDTLKEVANYLKEHGSVVQGFTTDISDLKTAVEALQTGMTKVEKSDINGNVKVNGAEVPVYEHPETHSADMIVDSATKVMMTAEERTKLAGASAVVIGALEWRRVCRELLEVQKGCEGPFGSSRG